MVDIQILSWITINTYIMKCLYVVNKVRIVFKCPCLNATKSTIYVIYYFVQTFTLKMRSCIMHSSLLRYNLRDCLLSSSVIILKIITFKINFIKYVIEHY